MAENEEFKVEKNSNEKAQAGAQEEGQKVIDESNYEVRAPRQHGPAVVGRGGDPFFRRIRATREQLDELLEETATVQDWVQKETCNKVALSCLNNENLKEVYFQIKDGFGEYGPILLMGFKTPQGVEIPRLKILNTEGEVMQVITGPLVVDELNRRAVAYREFQNAYDSAVDICEDVVEEETGVIQDYSGNPDDYT